METWNVVNFLKLFFRPGNSWNLSMGHGKSWKLLNVILLRMTLVKKTSLYDYIYLILEALYFFRVMGNICHGKSGLVLLTTHVTFLSAT